MDKRDFKRPVISIISSILGLIPLIFIRSIQTVDSGVGMNMRLVSYKGSSDLFYETGPNSIWIRLILIAIVVSAILGIAAAVSKSYSLYLVCGIIYASILTAWFFVTDTLNSTQTSILSLVIDSVSMFVPILILLVFTCLLSSYLLMRRSRSE